MSDNLIVKATKNSKGEWVFVKVIYLPEYGKDLPSGFTGRIISDGYFAKNYMVTKYLGGHLYFATFNSDNTWVTRNLSQKLKAGLPGDPRCTEEEGEGETVYAYVNGELNSIWYRPKSPTPPVCEDNPILGGGGGTGGGGTPADKVTKPTAEEMKKQIKDKPFALIPNIDCEIIKKWVALAKFGVDKSTLDRLIQIENILKQGNDNSYITNVQNINNAYSEVVNMDYFPISVNIMPLVNGKVSTPEVFIEYIRKNINSFVNTGYSKFNPYVYSGVDDTKLWNSSNPKNSVIAIDIGGPDDGSVIVSDYRSSGWTFTTLFEPKYGIHPVSGNRQFGFIKNTNGSYTFYTRGVDRITTFEVAAIQSMSGVPFAAADALWTSFQKGITDYVNKNGGSAAPAKQEIHRPNWEQVKAVADGKAPLSSLSTDCK